MLDEKKLELFEQKPVPQAVLTLSIPTILSSLVMVLYNLTDTLFVGMLNDPIHTAAVTLAAPVLLAFNAVNNLFGVGTSSMMSRALGRQDYNTVYRSSAFGFYMSLLCGACISLFCGLFQSPLLTILGTDTENVSATAGYLFWTTTCGAVPAILNVVLAYLVRSEGATLHASIGTMSGCFLNIILDPIFILPWGLNMGAAGAGCATFLSNCVACLYFFVLLFVKRGRTMVCINPKLFSFRKEIVLGICSVGIPASIQNLLNVTGMTILNNFMADFGSNAVAAMGIAHKIGMVPLYVAMGVGQGITPLVSYTYASERYQRMKEAILFASKISVAGMIVFLVLFYAGAGFLIALFMDNAEIIAYGTQFLRGLALSLPFMALDFLAVGVFQACGMGGTSLLFAILRKIALEIPALYILNQLFPMYGLAYAQLTAEFVLSIAAVLVLHRLFQRAKKNEGQA